MLFVIYIYLHLLHFCEKMRKILALGIIMSFLFLMIPLEGVSGESYEKESSINASSDFLTLAHVVARGTGRCLTIHGAFFLGFGRCWAMFVNLEDDGYIEITSLLDSSNSITLEGSHKLVIIGFMGLRMTLPKVNINGLALLVSY